MAALVMGILVTPRAAPLPELSPARRLRLQVGERAGVRYGDDPALGYAPVNGAAAEAVTSPGPLIVLTRGEPGEPQLEASDGRTHLFSCRAFFRTTRVSSSVVRAGRAGVHFRTPQMP